MIGSVSTMMVSRSRDKEAYLKEAYDNVRSTALQDLNPFRLCVTLPVDTIKSTGVVSVLLCFDKCLLLKLKNVS